MIERRIKELAIALEALSRINGWAAENHFNGVSELLKKAIEEAKEPTPPPKSIAKTEDDDIPF